MRIKGPRSRLQRAGQKPLRPFQRVISSRNGNPGEGSDAESGKRFIYPKECVSHETQSVAAAAGIQPGFCGALSQ